MRNKLSLLATPSWASRVRPHSTQTADYRHRGHFPLEKFTLGDSIENDWRPTWHTIHNATKERFVIKRITPTDEAFYEELREKGSSIEDLEYLKSKPENYMFATEREAFGSALMRRLSPNDSPVHVDTVVDHQNNYYIASHFIEGFKSFAEIFEGQDVYSEFYDEERFFIGEEGETRLWLNKQKGEHVAITGRIWNKLALNAAGEGDQNLRNIGIQLLPNRDPNEPCRVKTIDHEACLQFPEAKVPAHIGAKKIARGESFTVHAPLNLNHLHIKKRHEAREKAVSHITNVFYEEKEIKQLFFEYFSTNYPLEIKKQIQEIGQALQSKAAAFSLANALLTARWDETDKHADHIFKKLLGPNYESLSRQEVWDRMKAQRKENALSL
ncbi:MAG: hypothetical protein K0R63_838 [Rickettsiales bacterium]|jgi:hypothetical protein|nr:hypothetical protein [Rickettsiales bacterium]